MRDLLTKVLHWTPEHGPCALARVVAVRGSSPRPLGAAMVIWRDGRFMGSVSGGCVEGEVIRMAGEVIADGKARMLEFRGDADPILDIALGCGGDETIFVEPLCDASGILPVFQRLEALLRADVACELTTSLGSAPTHALLDEGGVLLFADALSQPDEETYRQDFIARPHLVVIGADAVGEAVAALAAALGWKTTVVDPRPAWLTPGRFPEDRIAAYPQVAFAQLTLDAKSAVVVLSHDPKLDEPALVGALGSPAGYVGALGSRTAHANRVERLIAAGLSTAEIARIHAPIGLDLGGHTPQEIALSILAEITAERNGRTGQPLRISTGPIHTTSTPVCEPLEKPR